MRAEIIAIGDELVSGQKVDTNSVWLSEQFAALGIPVAFHTVIGDDMSDNLTAFQTAVARVPIVLSTGGLGPTGDDLTREVLAHLAQRPLVLHEPSWDHIRALFAARGRPMPERNRVQAMLPEGAEAIPNPHGTAPGIYLSIAGPANQTVHIFALPGVPSEMRQMWSESVAPRIQSLLPQRRWLKRHVIKCFGLGESELEARLPDLVRRGKDPLVGITVSQATIALRIQAEGRSDDECTQKIDATVRLIRDCLGPVILGEGEAYELQHAVLDQLAARRLTLAVTEAGTLGLITSWLAQAAAAQSPTWFRGGCVYLDPTYHANGASLSCEHRAQLAAQWALDLRRKWSCDIALAVGPWPAKPGVEPEGHLHFALAAEQLITRSVPVAGAPDLLRIRAAKQALDFVRMYLIDSI